MFWEFPLKIQTYDSENQQWGHRDFSTKREFISFIREQFLESPELYKYRHPESFQLEGLRYSEAAKKSGKANFEGGYYTKFVKGSYPWKNYWKNEKDKTLKGIIVDGYFIPPFYYWYLNFCPIYDDLAKKRRLPDVWDGDLWYMHYVTLAILLGKHVGGVKGRQKGYSYKHMAILYWSYCWGESSVNTVGAFDEKLVKKSWRFLEGYRKHINTYTAWKRGPVLPKALEWNEATLAQDNTPRGNLSILKGVTFKQSAFNDVGGAQTFFNYEEPGVSPTLLETFEAMRPALVKGSETTGTIIACGSVGELEDAEGLKTVFYNPDDYDFLSVKNIWDKNVTPDNDRCCIFISEAYNMIGTDKDGLVELDRPFMDSQGHSDVEFSMKWIEKMEEKIKNSSKKAELKQLQLSQKCTSPEQAFAQRKLSEFPIELLKKQQERIKLKDATNSWEFKPQKGLFEDVNGRTVLNTRNLPPEHGYPINAEWDDKRGVWTLYELPDENAEFYTYFACVDAIEVDETSTSASIASVDIFKTAVHVVYEKDKVTGREKTRLEGDKLVATYRGRFKTAKQTNEQIWLGLRLYNAFTYPERNKPNFINYMREIGKAEKYLAREQDVPMFKDLNIKNSNTINNSKFGFHKGDNTEIWTYFKAYAKEYFHTEYNRTTFTKNGEEQVLKIFTGIDRIDDYWLLEEFIRYVEVKGKAKGNYDRLVSFMGALFITKIYQQNRFIKRKSELVEENKPTYKAPKSINMLGGGFRPRPNRKPGKSFSML
jgi:hypothetical protein